MNSKQIIRIISDFNAAPLSNFLKKEKRTSEFEVELSSYGQVYQTLAIPSNSSIDIVWTKPELTLPSFKKACQLEEIKHSDVLQEVKSFAKSVIAASENRYIFVASWILSSNINYGMLDWQSGLGLSNLLSRCNLLLADEFSKSSNVYLMQSHGWMQGEINPNDRKMWYTTKIPYTSGVFKNAARYIAQCINGIEGKSRRLIILDLDNTLWGGVVGESGWGGLRLGGHDHIGEAFKDFQLALKSLSNKGVQLAISSKNDEVIAMDAIENHPEMILKKNDFAGWRINWQDKALNISDLASELNLGLDSMVFIDDNPSERIRVGEALPGIIVPEWPSDPANFVDALGSLNYFENTSISSEDRQRTMMYVSERDRRDTKVEVGNIEVWLKKLRTKLCATTVERNNISRVAQLLNKTNQLNLSTRRMSENEIIEWLAKENRSMLTVALKDIYGDMGLIGIVSVEVLGDCGRLVDFVLSCRAIGRRVEDTLIYLACDELISLGAKSMDVFYLPTNRNGLTLEVLEKSNLERVKKNYFRLNLDKKYDKPSLVELIYERNL